MKLQINPIRRRPLRRHKEIRQAIKTVKAAQSKSPALAHHFDATIRSLQTAIVADVIIAVENGGCWTTRDFMDYCRVSRRVIDAILCDLEKQGIVNKSIFFRGGKGRRPYKFQATQLARERQNFIKNENK